MQAVLRNCRIVCAQMGHLEMLAPPSNSGGCHSREADVCVTSSTLRNCGEGGGCAAVCPSIAVLVSPLPIWTITSRQDTVTVVADEKCQLPCALEAGASHSNSEVR
jgi:hypothetical protein